MHRSPTDWNILDGWIPIRSLESRSALPCKTLGEMRSLITAIINPRFELQFVLFGTGWLALARSWENLRKPTANSRCCNWAERITVSIGISCLSTRHILLLKKERGWNDIIHGCGCVSAIKRRRNRFLRNGIAEIYSDAQQRSISHFQIGLQVWDIVSEWINVVIWGSCAIPRIYFSVSSGGLLDLYAKLEMT